MERTSSPPPTVGRFTWSDFIALPEDDLRELIDGQLVEMEVPSGIHEWIVAVLVRLLGSWAMERRAGVVFASGYKVKIREDRGFMPDVQYFRRGGRPVPFHGLDAGAPDLAVEIVSPGRGRFDRVVKLGGYAAIGVPEYWIVDPERRTLERLVLEATGAYRIAEALSGDATLELESFPGLAIDLGDLWQLPDWFLVSP
jgi:Uma2 family endonuclease